MPEVIDVDDFQVCNFAEFIEHNILAQGNFHPNFPVEGDDSAMGRFMVGAESGLDPGVIVMEFSLLIQRSKGKCLVEEVPQVFPIICSVDMFGGFWFTNEDVDTCCNSSGVFGAGG